MNTQRWEQVKALFEAALDRPESERAAFLAAAGADPDTQREVESLLSAHRDDDFLPEAGGLRAAAAALRSTSLASQRVGAYRIIEPIGEGGMGVVFLAERDDQAFEKRVAIKVARPGALSDSALRRFRQERQIIATLDHPGIARLLDGGTTSDGLPYFVLEYVDGLPIDEWCDANSLTIRERVELFLEVCSAIEYAHARGVIHRDLKPHNILVTRAGTTKLLDFGIAKDVGGDAEPAVTTISMMTPEYASPEQVRGEAATPAIDVYALGVLLYRLLSGQGPYRVRTGTAHELAQAICEQQPVRPSAVLAATGDRTRAALVRNDLDAIVLTAIRKEPERRYASVGAFADDLRRCLDGRAVAARRGDFRYRASKLIRRHKSRIAVAMALTVSLAAAGWMVFERQYSARPISESSRRTLAVLPFKPLESGAQDDYLALGMADALITRLGGIGALIVRPTSSVVRYATEDADALTVGRQLGVEVLIDGRFQRRGDRFRVMVQLVRVADGETLWADAFDEPIHDLLRVQDAISQRVAETLVTSLTPDERSRLAAGHTANTEAYQLYVRGRYFWERRTGDGIRKSIDYYRQAIAADPEYALAFAGLADSYNILGNVSLLPPHEAYPQATAAAEQALRLDDRLSQARIAMAFATYLYDRDWTAAEPMFTRALAETPNYGPGHQWYAVCLVSRGRFDEARAEIHRAVELDPSSLVITAVEAWISFLSRRYPDAVAQARQALEMDERFGLAYTYLAQTYTASGQYQQAADALRASIAYNRDTRDQRHLGLLGLGFAKTGQADAARRTIDEIRALAQHQYMTPYGEALVRVGLGENEKAMTLLEQAAGQRYPWAIHFNIDPLLDPLRGDPRFEALLQRLGLPSVTVPH